jgi:DNA-binding GntR family transcriptional regulator
MSEFAALTLKAPARQTLADSVTESLRVAIFSGLLRPGQQLAEGPLASRLNVSRAPVREALASLEQEGIVSRAPGGGTAVARLTRKDAEEICSLRVVLEGLALRLALANENQGLGAALGANLRATEGIDDPQQLAQRDLEFHELIVRAAEHGRLLASWLNLSSQIRLIMVQHNLADADSTRETVLAHRELLEAIKARDVARALAALERQLEKQHQWIIGSFARTDAV